MQTYPAHLAAGEVQRWRDLEPLSLAEQALFRSLRVDDVLQALADIAVELLPADKSSVLVWDGTHERLSVRAAHGFHPDSLAKLSFAPGEGPSAWVGTSGEPTSIADVRSDPRIPPRLCALNQAEAIAAHVSVPIKLGQEVFGVFDVASARPNAFDSDAQWLALALAGRAALAIQTARVVAQSERSRREMEGLYRADAVLHRSLVVDDVLQALVEVATENLNADKASVLVWDRRRERLVVGAAHGYSADAVANINFAPDEGIAALVVRSGRTFLVDDLAADPRASPRATQYTDAESIRSLICVPIMVEGQVYGIFNASFCQQRSFQQDDGRPFEALAQRAALAIQNARLFSQSERSRREVEALYRADEALHRSLELDDVLRALVNVATDILGADKTAVLVWDTPRERLIVGAARGYSAETAAQMSAAPGEGPAGRVAVTGQTVVVDDATLDTPERGSFTALLAREGVGSYTCVPIVVNGQVFGVFTISYCQPWSFTEEDQRPIQALAQRAAVAIQNARLYEHSQQAATLEERQRLARELHDAVTQTLFSASLIADVLPRLWRIRPDEVLPRLEQLRRLSRGALAEMRTLLVELRPAALSEMPFGDLVQQLVEATAARIPARLDVRIEGTPRRLPADVQLGLYRLAQEALSNVTKHARASQVEVHVRWADDGLVLRIRDDGRGFEPAAIPAGHFGIGFMRERAAAIEATLDISSRPGAGTTVTIDWRSR